MEHPLGEPERREILRFSRLVGLIAVLLAAAPALFGYLEAGSVGTYLGFQTNLDDHMVYAAWMRQAIEGRFLFENRFTTDAQPGLTIHLYFWALGLFAKVIGIPVAALLARLALSYCFVALLARFLLRLETSVFTAKFALVIATFGGGLGFLAWQNFGQAIDAPNWFEAAFLSSRVPIDVWQPEAFVFPSMLTNSLFMASLCLILVCLNSVLDARTAWKPVAIGAAAMAVLMNIHSYDVLLLTLVLLAFAGSCAVGKSVNPAWVARVAIIGVGAIPPALWFLYVLRSDPVFQARAETLTFAPNFRQVLFGLLPVVALALVSARSLDIPKTRKRAGVGLVGAFIIVLFLVSGGHDPNGYFTGPLGWALMLAVAALALGLLSSPSIGFNLLWSWALIGLVAIYFPALFQRKLAMGMILPWACLAGVGLAAVLPSLERGARNLVATVVLTLTCATSILWMQREVLLIRTNVSSTTVHPVFLSRDAKAIVDYLAKEPGRKVVLAPPGVPFPSETPGQFLSPYLPDLNPIVTGLAGATTYAGHWSETPRYVDRRNDLTRIYLSATDPMLRSELIQSAGPDYIVAPVPETFPALPLADLRGLGNPVYTGNQFCLIQVRP